MNYIKIRNGQTFPLKTLPTLALGSFIEETAKARARGERHVALFGMPCSEAQVRLVSVLADDAEGNLCLISALSPRGNVYPSLTKDFHEFHMAEREIWENFGIRPEGHPWLKPVRYPRKDGQSGGRMEDYPFFSVDGGDIHEVAVGPVHAGVIEPGHFRFMCSGETVRHLEIQLGYQHRGMEAMLADSRPLSHKLRLAECIAGDSVCSHAGAFVSCVESLAGLEPSPRAMSIRALAQEFERAASHLGDLGALSGDVAYLPGASHFGALRTLAINSSLAVCGSRFGRGLLAFGGVSFDIDEALAARLKKSIIALSDRAERMCEALFSAPSVLSRFEKTGVVGVSLARDLGLVGFPARASGLSLDVRSDNPYGRYSSLPLHSVTMSSGDVFARAYLRYVEMRQSLRMALDFLDDLGEGPALPRGEIGPLAPESMAVSLTEGWRGETFHASATDGRGNLRFHKVQDPSFRNWFGLAMAVRGNGVSDFPLCNKSFNLSYCGFDL